MKKSKAVKPWVCRLYPERRSSLYVLVQVWPTKSAFLKHIGEHCNFGDGKLDRRTEGTCGTVHRWKVLGKASRKTGCFAIVNLWLGSLTMRVVTHELFHATIAWARRVRFDMAALTATDDVTDHEERITHAHSELCSEFMRKASLPGAPYHRLGHVVKSA